MMFWRCMALLMGGLERVFSCSLAAGMQPFVMWMDARAGSTWEMSMLNSHARLVALGESLTTATSLELCQFFQGGKGRGYRGDVANGVDGATIEARGYKVRLQCESRQRGGVRAAASVWSKCAGPESPQFGTMYAFWRQHKFKVICAVRANSVDRAISLLAKTDVANRLRGCNRVAGKLCGAPTNVSVTLDPRQTLTLARASREHYETMRLVCGDEAAPKRRLETFVLEYDDVLKDAPATFKKVLDFLGVDSSVSLRSNINAQERGLIKVVNAKDVARIFMGTRLEPDARQSPSLAHTFPDLDSDNLKPKTCIRYRTNAAPVTLRDRTDWHKLDDLDSKNCSWVSNWLPARCSIKGHDRIFAFEACQCSCSLVLQNQLIQLPHHRRGGSGNKGGALMKTAYHHSY